MRRGLIAAAALMGSVTGLFIGLGTSSSAGAAQSVAASSSPGHLGSGGQGSNARSGPAAGGSSGTVGNVAKSSFTLTTSAGQEVTVDEASSTKYEKGTSSTSKSTITKGEHVLVLGTVSSTTIKATQVIVQTTGGGSEPSTVATVVPFQRGAQETSKQVGQIPASYSEGSGTIVSGTTANKATEAALAAYPGGNRRPCCEADQRRIRGPQHRRQLATPRLRQPGLQGGRRRVAVDSDMLVARPPRGARAASTASRGSDLPLRRRSARFGPVDHLDVGSAQESGQARRWLFELGAARVFLTIVADNEGSVAAARRAGFVYEGTMRSHGVWQGRRCDVMWFAALPLEWTMRRPDEHT